MEIELRFDTASEVEPTLRKFNLDHDDVRLIRAAGATLAPQLTQMVEDWYQWLGQQDAFQTYFANNPRTLERVRSLQHRHWEQMFEAKLDAQYFAGRRRIGAVHAHIDLPNDIYYAGMCIAIRLLLERVMRLDPAPAEAEGMLHALNKICMLDTYLTCDEISRIQRDKLEVSSKALMEMSTPVTPIWEGILLLPLVGILDSVRTQEIMTRSLSKIAETRARCFVLDISGVGAIDTAVANQLIKITKATLLMGCESIISGISPAVARTLVELGVQVGDVKTTSTLRDALEIAMRVAGTSVARGNGH